MDPFIEVYYLDKKYRTKAKQDQGKNPKWNETF
jgi:hypothetical protein